MKVSRCKKSVGADRPAKVSTCSLPTSHQLYMIHIEMAAAPNGSAIHLRKKKALTE
jgi:hypothetical protein